VAEKIELHPERTSDAKQIVDASYGPDRPASCDLQGRLDSRSEYIAMTQHQITDADYAAALAACRTETETEIRAQAVHYVPDRDAIEIVTTRNAGFLIPRQWSARCKMCPRKIWDSSRSGRTDRRSSGAGHPHQRAWFADCGPACDAAAARGSGELRKSRWQSDLGGRSAAALRSMAGRAVGREGQPKPPDTGR
jgi:hypothetical protein